MNRFLAILAFVMLIGCASGPKVRSQTDTTTDLGRFSTYGFGNEAGGSQGYASFVEQHVRAAVAREMERRGYRPDASPDLLVYYALVTKEKLQVSQMPATYGGWRRGYAVASVYQTDVRQYTEGTLAIDVVDRAKSSLAWQGTAIGQIKEKSLENPQPAIDAVVAQIFSNYPAQARTASRE